MASPNSAKERERRIRIRNVELTMDLLSEGVPTHEIDARLYEAKAQIGKNSQERARTIIGALDMVKRVDNASEQSDNDLKVDLWVRFKPEVNHASVGVQVKSSRHAVDGFLANLPPGTRIMGINAGLLVSDLSIQRSFLHQLYEFDGFI